MDKVIDFLYGNENKNKLYEIILDENIDYKKICQIYPNLIINKLDSINFYNYFKDVSDKNVFTSIFKKLPLDCKLILLSNPLYMNISFGEINKTTTEFFNSNESDNLTIDLSNISNIKNENMLSYIKNNKKNNLNFIVNRPNTVDKIKIIKECGLENSKIIISEDIIKKLTKNNIHKAYYFVYDMIDMEGNYMNSHMDTESIETIKYVLKNVHYLEGIIPNNIYAELLIAKIY